MLLRRFFPPAAAVLALACVPSIQQDAPPASVSYAVFDPLTSQIPLPNDLALLDTSIAGFPPSAQRDLLTQFALNGGFPNDQEVALTFDLQTLNINPKDGTTTPSAPDLDFGSISTTTLKLIKLPGTEVVYCGTAAGTTPATKACPPITAADYFKGTDRGTLTLHNKKDASGNGPLPWDSGAVYALAVRGGASGVKLTGGATINPTPTFFLLTRGKDLALPENQTLIPGATAADKMAAGTQLEFLRQRYLTPFTAVDSLFGGATPASQDLAVLATFHIAPATAPHVETDPGRGLIPLPSDFLLDSSGKLVQTVAAFGPLAPGIATLDGFSTTATILATVSGPIVANSVNKNTVFLYDMSNPAAPARVPDATEAGGVYVSEPPQITQTVTGLGTVSTAIGLQPAIPVPTGVASSPILALPPLKENTEYVVLISDGVKDATNPGQGMTRSTLGSLMLFPPEHPVAAGGKALVSGVPDGQAVGLENMRQLLHPAIAKLNADKGVTRDHLVMAYSFRTQSITGTGDFLDTVNNVPAAQRRGPGLIQFAALPYSNPALSTLFAPASSFKVYTPAQAWTKWGLDAATPNSDIGAIIHATVTTFDLLSDVTGAFDPALLASATPPIKPIKVLIATPQPANAPACPAQFGLPAGVKCPPLVIFHHGLGGSKANMLELANQFTKRGFMVAAIDGAKHGDRAWCSSDAQCDGGAAGSCVKIPNSENQGDSKPPGICSTRNLRVFTNCSTLACAGAWAAYSDPADATDKNDGLVADSANYFVSTNFFRTRDTMRQDLIDQSALILALSRPPATASLPDIPAANKALTGFLCGPLCGAPVGLGLYADPTKIYWTGISLGAILGTLNVAANPRLSKGVLNVGGGTLTDILTNAPSFTSSVGALLASAGITPGTAAYLQFLLVAKWILDPADPINAAGHLLGGTAKPTLPDLLGGTANQAAKGVIGQMAACDLTVPNAFNAELFLNIGLGPKSASTSTYTIFADTASPSSSCPAAAVPLSVSTLAVPHAFMGSWGVGFTFSAAGVPSFTNDANVAALGKIAQDQAAAFLFDNTLPLPIVALP